MTDSTRKIPNLVDLPESNAHLGILSVLQSVSLVYFYLEMAKLLREGMFNNGTLFKSEVYYGLTKYNINKLEDVDKVLLKRVLETKCLYLDSLIIHLISHPLTLITSSTTWDSSPSSPSTSGMNSIFPIFPTST